ncbi:MAG: hypothetical protein HW421_2561 [Ignavibacteria bacterium]|nr:hypothetical protein [Ignavibacteria bacterium]
MSNFALLFRFLFLAGFSFLLFHFDLASQSKTSRTNKTDDLSQQEIDIMTAGPQHQLLYMFEGSWKVLFTYYQELNPESFGKGESENKLFFNNKFIEINTELQTDELTFHLKMTLGFDKRISKYFIFVLDDISTYPRYAEGDYDEETRTFTFSGEAFDIFKSANTPFKITLKFEDDRKFVFKSIVGEGKKAITTYQMNFLKK